VPNFAGAPHSALYAEAVDGRPIFFVPWNRQLLIGTTEVPDRGDPGATQPSATEIAYLLKSANQIFPKARLTAASIVYAFAGVRPLPFVAEGDPAAITRRHLLRDHGADGARGMISIVGGKLTTAASLARECARALGLRVQEPTMALAADGAENVEALALQWSRQIAKATGLSKGTATALAEWYGPRAMTLARAAAHDERLRQPLCAHTQHIVAEAVVAAEDECAVSLGDILLRRVPVALGRCWSDACTRNAAERIGRALGWSAARIGLEQEEFAAERAAFLVKPQRIAEAVEAASVAADHVA
jgi:glycerol-3-phosphate dehydrogenase